MSNRPNSPVSYKTEHHKYLVTLSPLFTRAGVVCKSGAHKAEQPHLWRVIKPQSGERGGEAAAKQESLRLRPFINRPSLPCGALTTWTTGAVSSDSDATNAPSL